MWWPLSDVRRWCVAGLWLGCGRRGRCAWYGSTGAAAPSMWVGGRVRCQMCAAGVWLGCGCDVVAVAGVPGVDPPARLGVDWPLWVRCSLPLKYALCALFSAFSARFSAFFALLSANGIFFHTFTRPVLCPLGGRWCGFGSIL